MADEFSRDGKSEGRTDAEVKDLQTQVRKLAVENDFLSEGLKR